MGVSGQLYHIPLPSASGPVELADVDLRLDEGPNAMGNISATTFAGRVVGDNIMELIDVELYGLKLTAGSPTVFCISMDIDLREAGTSKMR
jgi:hypothetical protein